MTVVGTRWRHLVWDMGGTLVDTYPSVDRTLRNVCRAHGCAVEDHEVMSLTRVSIGHACAELARRCGIPEEEFTAAYADLKRSWRTAPPPVMAGARELLAEATRRGGLNIIVTHRDRESAEDLLRVHGIVVDDVICAPDGLPRKPDPTMHRLALQRHGLDPRDCLAVGDRAIDGTAAQRAGIASVWLVTPDLPAPAAESRGVAVIHHLGELLVQ